jgi:Endoribonuclease L-PSP
MPVRLDVISETILLGETLYANPTSRNRTAHEQSGGARRHRVSRRHRCRQPEGQRHGRVAGAGTDKSKLLSANIWITDMANFAEMNAVWDAWVSPGNTPARATVEAKLASLDYVVEIMVVAAR